MPAAARCCRLLPRCCYRCPLPTAAPWRCSPAVGAGPMQKQTSNCLFDFGGSWAMAPPHPDRFSGLLGVSWGPLGGLLAAAAVCCNLAVTLLLPSAAVCWPAVAPHACCMRHAVIFCSGRLGTRVLSCRMGMRAAMAMALGAGQRVGLRPVQGDTVAQGLIGRGGEWPQAMHAKARHHPPCAQARPLCCSAAVMLLLLLLLSTIATVACFNSFFWFELVRTPCPPSVSQLVLTCATRFNLCEHRRAHVFRRLWAPTSANTDVSRYFWRLGATKSQRTQSEHKLFRERVWVET